MVSIKLIMFPSSSLNRHLERWHSELSDPMEPKGAGIVNKALKAIRDVSVENDTVLCQHHSPWWSTE